MSSERTIPHPLTRAKAVAVVVLLILSVLSLRPHEAGAQEAELTTSDMAFISYEVTIHLTDVEGLFDADEHISYRYGW